MDTWNQKLAKLIASYEASLLARHTNRVEEDQEADEALTSTLLEAHDNTVAGLEKLDNEQIELKDEVVKLQDEILAKLDAIDDKARQREELKNEAKALEDLHSRGSEEARQELDRKRGLEDMDLRASLHTELVCPLLSFPACANCY
ncbi:hypothetical protein AUP68_06423 [Ilyonectria robusta]